MRAAIASIGVALAVTMAAAQPVSQRITAADTALLFGGADAEGGIGDWYVSNGVVQAIIDDIGPAPDLVGVLPSGQEPPIQSEISPTGGTVIDLGRVGQDGDEIPQLFTVGGLSTSNFILYDAVSAPAPGVIRASGKLLLPPTSVQPTPCIDIVTDHAAAGSDPFLTITTTATNQCGGVLTGLGGFLDAIVWTQRGIVPFSGGAAPLGGRGFNHPTLDLANPIPSVEFPTFVGAPGMLRASDGVMDPANGTVSSEIAYGLLPVQLEIDADGPGGAAPVVTPLNAFFGISSPLVTAVGGTAGGVALQVGGTVTYVRRVYVGAGADVRAVSNAIIPELATRLAFQTGTISGNVDAADTSDVAASILVTRLGRCTGDASRVCKGVADCTGAGACADTVPLTAFNPGGAVTQIRTDAAGAFSGVVLPFGDYELAVSSPERDGVTVRPVTVVAGDTPVTIGPLSARGTLSFAVREKAKGRPSIPSKLVVKGTNGTPDPRFHYDLTATLGTDDIHPDTFGGTQHGSDGSALGQGNVIYSATGMGSIQLRPGSYDVYASRGPEYGVMKRSVTIPSAGSASLEFRLKRVVQTKNALAADFHVHSGRSLDSSAPLADRVVSFAAEAVEVMVSTDHDKQVDYTSVIADLGLGARVATIPGAEITGSVPNPPVFPNSIGHINAWPLPLSKDAPRDGSIQDEYVAPNWVFKRLHDEGGPGVVVQYNHPRAGVSGLTNIGFFNSIGCGRCANAIDTTCTLDTDCPAGPNRDCTCVGFQPDRPLTMPPNDILLDSGILGPGTTANPTGLRNIDFDVMEIANGAKVGDFAAYRQVRDDWFAILAQLPTLKPGTGVSDSHRITVEHAGWSRTYVLGVSDDPAALDVALFDANVKAGHMVVSAGPWIQATARQRAFAAGPGDTLATDGPLRLKIDVRAPAWIPVEEVRIVTIAANGVSVRKFDATTKPRVRAAPKNFQSSGGTARFRGSVPLEVTSDALILVEAGVKLPDDPATLPVSPEIVNVVEPEVVPLAFTNPILIDQGGDGFSPPGPVAALRTGAPAGRMTGVTAEQRAAAVARGDHFPIYAFQLTPAEIDAARAGGSK